MGIEFEGQTSNEVEQIRRREVQKESIDKLNKVSDMVDNINIDGIESDTKTIREMVTNNLENQINLDDISDTLDKVFKGITDIKRNQTNINKKINDIQDKIGE